MRKKSSKSNRMTMKFCNLIVMRWSSLRLKMSWKDRRQIKFKN